MTTLTFNSVDANHVRYPVALMTAMVLTGMVFWGLTFLIQPPRVAEEEVQTPRIIDTALPPERKALPRQRHQPVKPEPVVQPTADGVIPQPDVVRVNPGPEKVLTDWVPTGDPVIEFNPVAADREVAPLVRIEPDYPPNALNRGVEGHVILRFSVNGAGAVIEDSIEIVEAEPSSIFNAAARRAVRKWKYAPRIVDGKPVPQHGIRTSLVFRLPE